jgi:hypothetical protein
VEFNDEELAKLNLDMPIEMEQHGFAPEQMVMCDACLRANPPTRSECLYCAAPLPITEASLSLRQPTLRPLEKWEQGFNCILMPTAHANSLPDEQLAEAAQLLRIDVDVLKKLIETRKPLPLARATTQDDATLIKNRLAAAQHAFDSLIIADQELALESAPPVRLRTFEFTDEELIGHSIGDQGVVQASWERIQLLVSGRLYVRRVEVQERSRRGRSEDEIVEAHEFGADEALLDIYVELDGGEWSNWRVSSASFDFSCLTEKKSLLASQNFQTMIELLKEKASAARFDDSYKDVRQLLSGVWPLEQHTDSRGWRRERPGKYSTEIINTSTNEKQFTLYSRLQHYLLQREADSAK